MPGFFQRPHDRRSFLKFGFLGGAAVLAQAGRHGLRAADRPPELHYALLADTHVPGDPANGHRGFRPGDNLRKIVPDILDARPEGMIIGGDAARLVGLIEDYAELRDILEPVAREMPVVIGLGNHDDRGNFFKIFPNLPGNRPSVPGRHVTVIEHEVVRVLVLDSLLYVDRVAGLLGRDQRNWLVEYLPKVNDRPLVIVVHHTLGDGDGDLLDVDRLFEILRPHRQVKAIFYGHSHVWNLGRREGVHLVNLPAVGYNFRDQDPVGWVQARFGVAGVSLTLRALAGNRAEDGRTVALEWAA